MPHAVAAFDATQEFEGILTGGLPKLQRIAFRYLDDSEDAKDAVQDALLSAFRHVSQFQHRSQLSTWLHRIIINAALMKLRVRQRQVASSIDASTGEDGMPLAERLVFSGPSPERLCEQAELRETLEGMIQRLPPKQRRAYELCAGAGWSLREAARMLGMSESALKCSLARARKTLRHNLQQCLQRQPSLETPPAARTGSRRDVM